MRRLKSSPPLTSKQLACSHDNIIKNHSLSGSYVYQSIYCEDCKAIVESVGLLLSEIKSKKDLLFSAKDADHTSFSGN